ncbi:hypothetical protein L6164_030104 [Bauhinia variegata]|uniref:Uncharacterized protein n=1 Tax=Bauhinia variegata TaxID=167791 RepID=A0ACB9LC58_BAUVA|nr:hypothetical protein L6164_030104 [Bauhinia variegata]
MPNEDLFTSLISDIKTYTGKDPLLPWLRGIRKMKDTLPRATLNEKLPRFLEKCAQTFESDRRYRNDMRYLRVWLQLMDFVDDAKTLLRTMEVNHIGTTRCQFYQAYALYYEKTKRYEEADKMYHLGVKNLAEPVEELQKSYEEFLHRMEKKNKKRGQQREVRAPTRPLCTENILPHGNKMEISNDTCSTDDVRIGSQHVSSETTGMLNDKCLKTKKDKRSMFAGDDTVVVKFVDTAIVGKSEAEDACHHGLVDPTINMKEAMNAINSMFSEPLEAAPIARKSHKNRPKEDHSTQTGFEVFIDENLDNGTNPSGPSSVQHRTEVSQPQQEPFQIYIDDEGHDEKGNIEQTDVRNMAEDSTSSEVKPFVFLRPKDLTSENSGDIDGKSSRRSMVREDTVIRRFVGSTVSDEPEVENVCHHGLVDPTINLKEAMDDINNMFGKPIDFVRRKRSRKPEKAPEIDSRKEVGRFSILADDDLENQQAPPPPKFKGKSTESGLFEPTLVTKEAMEDINKMFNMPLDF